LARHQRRRGRAGSDGISMSYSRRVLKNIRMGEASRTRVASLYYAILIALHKALLSANGWWFNYEKNLESYNIYVFYENIYKYLNLYEVTN